VRGYWVRDSGAPAWGAVAPRGAGDAGPGASAVCPPDDWASRDFLALDFETTGLDPRRDRVVEIGAIRFNPSDPGRSASMAALVDPAKPMPAAAFAIHGISDEDVRGAPSFASLALSLLALASGAILVAHNAPFDLSFLREELARAELSARFAPRGVFDTRLLAKRAFPGEQSYSLANLARAFGLEAGSAHRALDDARTCMGLFLLCAPRLAPGGDPHAA